MTEGRPYLVKIASSQNWYIRNGKARISTRTTDRAEAEIALASHVAARAGKGAAGPTVSTVGQALDHWGAEMARVNPKTWSAKWSYLVRTIKRHSDTTPLHELGKGWSRDYIAGRLAEGVSDPTIRQELSTLKTAVKLAKSDKLSSIEMPTLVLPAASAARDAFLTKDQARALIEACRHSHLRLFVRLGLATGGRPGAILALEWPRVHLDAGHVDLRTPSSRETRNFSADGRARRKRAARVPVEGDLLDELQAARSSATTRNVIEFRGRPVASIKKAFAAAVAAAALDPSEITPHVLRHSAATWMAQEGVDLWEIAGFLGHSDIAMVTRVYGHHHPDYLQRGMRAVAL